MDTVDEMRAFRLRRRKDRKALGEATEVLADEADLHPDCLHLAPFARPALPSQADDVKGTM